MENSSEKNKIGWEVLKSQAKTFSEKLDSALKELDIHEKCQSLEIDHICVRLKNNADVDTLKKELADAGKIISAVNVNGREITIFQINEPLRVSHWPVQGIELPYPKPNHKYEDGWEHVEFVLKGATNTMVGVRNSFIQTFSNIDLEKLKIQYEYSEDEPQSEGDQLPNPTIGLKINGIGLKFHAKPIQEIVGFQK